MKKIYLSVVCLMFLLLGCSQQSEQPQTKVITIKPETIANTLFYAGTIQPSKTIVVTSPADGVILDMPFQYGDQVDSGKRLFVISSGKFVSDYKTALMAYIKAKNDFNTSESQLSEAKFLHTNQLISDDDFKTKQSAYYGARLGLLQAHDSLEIFLNQLNIKDLDLYKLSISDIDKINKAMHLQADSQDLQILSPASGIVLSPNKSEEENKKFAKGDTVKQGDALAILGDINSLSVNIKVNELVVNSLKPGQMVTVTGMAFPNDILHGEITSVDRQGEGSSNGMPTFTAQITIPHISLSQQQEIHIGMSAKVQININEEPQISIPFTAISEKDGETFVTVMDDKSKKTHEVQVETGKTTMTAVRITSGLKEGDKIVVPA